GPGRNRFGKEIRDLAQTHQGEPIGLHVDAEDAHVCEEVELLSLKSLKEKMIPPIAS
ncbi:UNVERIFIED_CONTAM: hypothetical protein Sindi_0200900, partial [Sesamum indicum]